MANSRPRGYAALAVCGLLLLMALTAAVTIGSRPLDLIRAFHGASPDHEILLQLRLPRAVLAMWTGGALALSGVLFQALLRNSLATPYTLGVSGGASLGAVIAIVFGWNSSHGVSGVTLAAFAGSAIVLLLNVLLASNRGRMSSISLLLAGVTINSMCGAAVLFISNLVGVLKSFSVTRWLMGGIDAPDYETLVWLTMILTPTAVVVFWHSREWNLLSVGEAWAATRGVSTRRLLIIGCIAGSILTGAVTALTGPIAFVGLIVPHALRMWIGADHRILAPCSFLLGAAFVALCDVVSRTVLAPVEIPVGVITSLLGGPFFIWMLSSRQRGLSL
jgi:iron complex transport system permease protein